MYRKSFHFLSPKILAITFILTAAISKIVIFSHKQTKEYPSPAQHDSLTIALSDIPSTLHPHEARCLSDLSLVRQLFEGLVRENPFHPNGVELATAKSIHISKDELCYTFKLKKTYWSNGDPVTAQDFLLSWQHSAKLSPYSSLFEDIAIQKSPSEAPTLKIYAPDLETFIVHLKHPQPEFIKKISSPAFFPVHTTDTKGLITNGVYSLHSQTPNHSITLKKNEYYHDMQDHTLQQLVFPVIYNIHTSSRLLEKHQIHWLGQPWTQALPNEINQRLQEKQFSKISYPIQGSFWLTINPTKHPLNDTSFRKSLALSIDKSKLIKYVLQNQQSIAHTISPHLPAPSTTPYQSPSLSHTQQEPLTLTYPSDLVQCVRIVEFLQQEWKRELGIHINLKGMEYRRLIEERSKKNYDIITQTGRSLYPGAQGLYPIIKKQFYDHYLQSNITDTTPLSTEEMENKLLQDYIIIPLYHLSQESFLTQNIKNIIFCADGSVDLKYASLITKEAE